MEIKEMKIGDLVPYENNPRNNDEAVDAVAESIRQCGYIAPIIVDENNVILAGHTRLKALKRLGIDKFPVGIKEGLTEEQKRKYRLLDNKTNEFASWDFEKLTEELEGLDFGDFDFQFELSDSGIEPYDIDRKGSGKLSERFLIPPYSIFDTRKGTWQDRKRAWKALGIASEEGRSDGLLGEGLNQLTKKMKSNLTGTSIFDPVLCEIVYRWFNVDGGRIYDCFAGGSVRGIVAEYLGYSYTGIDLRQEQIDANIRNAEKCGLNPTWYCDDSQNADQYVKDNSCDLVFSCPPYADLEKYSDDPRDISTMEYDSFLSVYGNIISTALRKLKEDRFAVFVVGDVRDKKGFYRDFVSDTKRIFIDNGAMLYNEIILIEAGGTAALRASKVFQAGRKVVKTHQHVLVFYKGNPKKIKENYREVEVADIEAEGEEIEE